MMSAHQIRMPSEIQIAAQGFPKMVTTTAFNGLIDACSANALPPICFTDLWNNGGERESPNAVTMPQ